MKFKKMVSVLLAAVCVLSLAACGGSGDDSGSDASGGSDEAKKDSSSTTAKVIDIDLTEEDYAFGVDKTQPELLEQVNTFVGKIKEDGTLEEICDISFGSGEPEAVESAELDDSKDQLVVATNAAFEPFEYTKGENYYGIDMEIAALLAKELNKELVIQNMDFEAVCLSVSQQKCDIAMAGLTISKEREEYVVFTDSYYKASQRLVVPESETKFDDCADAEAVEALLNELGGSDSIGVQAGTTGQFYVEGDDELEFAGLPAKCVTYKSGSLAVQDMLNGNIKYVVIDAAPAQAITESINEMQ